MSLHSSQSVLQIDIPRRDPVQIRVLRDDNGRVTGQQVLEAPSNVQVRYRLREGSDPELSTRQPDLQLPQTGVAGPSGTSRLQAAQDALSRHVAGETVFSDPARTVRPQGSRASLGSIRRPSSAIAGPDVPPLPTTGRVPTPVTDTHRRRSGSARASEAGSTVQVNTQQTQT